MCASVCAFIKMGIFFFELNKRKSFSSTIAPIYTLLEEVGILYTVSRYGYGRGVDREGEREG